MSKQLEALMKQIKNKVYDVAQKELSENNSEKLKDAIDETVYRTPERNYKRTESMKNSVGSDVLRSANGIHITTSTNPEKMDYEYPSMSEKYPQDNRKWITNWLNNGHGGIWDYPAQNFIQEGQEKVDRSAIKVLEVGLKKRGLNVK